jgi:hypothetical protein
MAQAAELQPSHVARIGFEWSVPVWRWLRVPVNASGQGQGVLAVAVEAKPEGRVAIGDLEGVSLRTSNGRFRFAARVTGVTDLAFAADGSLWIASLSGLWRLDPDGRLADRSPAPGAPARLIRRVLVAPAGFIAVASEAGAWVSVDGVAWRRLADGLPRGPVSALALEDPRPSGPGGGTVGLWLVVGREVWQAQLAVGGARVELRGAQRVSIPSAPTAVVPRDLAANVAGADLVVIYPRTLAVRIEGEGFRIVRPVLPPGAVAQRMASGAGRVWLATDQGLLSAANVAGPWRRSESPAGSAAIRALALTAGRDGLLAASPSGLLHGAPVLLAAAPEWTPSQQPSLQARLLARGPDPDIRAVHAASLRYLDLGPERMRALRAGLDKRGWLPSLSLRVAAARDRRWGRDYDEAFLSGDKRLLYDREKNKSLDLEASLVMSWDLGALVFDEDAIDISREHRLIVSLRDNVIDEINQLYFERRGLLEVLRDSSSDSDVDVRRLNLRAAELAAGLDAWTGGWFSAHPSIGPGPEESP